MAALAQLCDELGIGLKGNFEPVRIGIQDITSERAGVTGREVDLAAHRGVDEWAVVEQHRSRAEHAVRVRVREARPDHRPRSFVRLDKERRPFGIGIRVCLADRHDPTPSRRELSGAKPGAVAAPALWSMTVRFVKTTDLPGREDREIRD